MKMGKWYCVSTLSIEPTNNTDLKKTSVPFKLVPPIFSIDSRPHLFYIRALRERKHLVVFSVFGVFQGIFVPTSTFPRGSPFWTWPGFAKGTWMTFQNWIAPLPQSSQKARCQPRGILAASSQARGTKKNGNEGRKSWDIIQNIYIYIYIYTCRHFNRKIWCMVYIHIHIICSIISDLYKCRNLQQKPYNSRKKL